MIVCDFYIRDIWIYVIEMLFYLFLCWKLFSHPNNPVIKSLAEEVGENTYLTEKRVLQVFGTLSVTYAILSFWGAIVCIIQIKWMEIAIDILNVVTIISAIIAAFFYGHKKK